MFPWDPEPCVSPGWLTMLCETEQEPVFTVKTSPRLPKLLMDTRHWVAGAEQASGTHWFTEHFEAPPVPSLNLDDLSSPWTWWQVGQTSPAKSFWSIPALGPDPIAKEWTRQCICCSPAALQGSVRFFCFNNCWRILAGDYYKECLLLPLGEIFFLFMLRYKGTFLVHFCNLTGNQEWTTEQEGHFVTESKPIAQYWIPRELWKTKLGWSSIACPWETSPSCPSAWESLVLRSLRVHCPFQNVLILSLADSIFKT